MRPVHTTADIDWGPGITLADRFGDSTSPNGPRTARSGQWIRRLALHPRRAAAGWAGDGGGNRHRAWPGRYHDRRPLPTAGDPHTARPAHSRATGSPPDADGTHGSVMSSSAVPSENTGRSPQSFGAAPPRDHRCCRRHRSWSHHGHESFLIRQYSADILRANMQQRRAGTTPPGVVVARCGWQRAAMVARAGEGQDRGPRTGVGPARAVKRGWKRRFLT
jgi:hypothetical protein